MDALDTFLATYPDSPVVLDVLGTLDAGEIRARVRDLEPGVEEIFHFGCSVGATFGLRLSDRSRVAVKVHKLFTDPEYFRAVQRVQAALHGGGFPAPRPIRVDGAVTVEEWVDSGAFRDGHDPDVRAALAGTLVRFVALASECGVRPRRTFVRPDSGPWPKPHNALFDFDSTSAGAEWIDEIGARAAAVERVGREVVAHLDWAAKHVRFDAELRPTAVYDWDSVTTELEPVVAGQAAASFAYTEELAVPVERWPTPDESRAFLADYERARGESFTPAEHRVAEAACVYLIAYAARCHHAVGGDPDDMHLARHVDAFL